MNTSSMNTIKPRIHLLPDTKNNAWVVKMTGEKKGKVFNNKKAAGRWMVQMAREKQVSKVIHGTDGKFQSRRSY